MHFEKNMKRRALSCAVTAAFSALLGTGCKGEINTDTDTSDDFTVEDFTVPVDAPDLSRSSGYLLYDATRFIYTGDAPMQKDVESDVISKIHVAVLKGRVFDKHGRGLEGVRVSILNETKYGSTLTRADGRYDLVVNAEGRMTLCFEKQGLMPSQRTLLPKAQIYNFVKDTALIPASSKAQKVSFQNKSEVQVAEGEKISDEDGDRQAILMFPPQTAAVAVLQDGSEVALNEGAVRITEYTVGAFGPRAMPGTLPSTSAYTYASALNIDEAKDLGATEVRFDNAVSFYVDNFLDFPVGLTVPVGYYDEEKGIWVASESGTIVSVADDGIDLDGDGHAETEATLSARGIDSWELAEARDRLTPGQSYWRASMTHFSSWDCNWPFSPPPDAVPPASLPSDDFSSSDNSCEQKGSVIMCDSQTLGERFLLTGTPYSLVYMSDRMRNRISPDEIRVPLSGDAVPENLKRIDFEAIVLGRQHLESFEPSPGLETVFAWDGLDAYGRTVTGAAQVRVRVGYVYDGYYQEAEIFGQTGSGEIVGASDGKDAQGGFDGNSVDDITGDKTREEVTLWREATYTVNRDSAPDIVAGGISIDVHHSYDPNAQILYLGTGKRRGAASSTRTIRTLDRHERSELLNLLAAAPDGSIYKANNGLHTIVRIWPDGTETLAAGNGETGGAGDGGPATEASLDRLLEGLAAADDGSFYVSGDMDDTVRKIDSNGIINTAAGGGEVEVGTEGIPALKSRLWSPSALATDRNGGLYIVENHNGKILYLGADDKIYWVAGGGDIIPGESGTAARKAKLGFIRDIETGPDGSLYIAGSYYETNLDERYYSSRIFRMEPSGTIRLTAGGGLPGTFGPATSSYLEKTKALSFRADGTLFLAGFYGHIDTLDSDGMLRHYAGCGDNDECGEDYMDMRGDNRPALASYLGLIEDIAVDTLGRVFFTGTGYVRRVHDSLPEFSEDGSAVASVDGKELYIFNRQGRHIKTQNALTGATLRSFHYDDNERLIGIEEAGGDTTVIERNPSGAPVAVMSPYGIRTELSVDEDGYLSSLTAPDGTVTRLDYQDGSGLLTGLVDGNGGAYTFGYDDAGRLVSDADPLEAAAKKAKTLSAATSTDGAGVVFTSAEGRETLYLSGKDDNGDALRTVTFPNGTSNVSTRKSIGKIVVERANGMSVESSGKGDVRFGFQAPVSSFTKISTPSGLMLTVRTEQQMLPEDPEGLFDFDSFTETKTAAGNKYTKTYDAENMTWTYESPEGRIVRVFVDAFGRVTSAEGENTSCIDVAYDTSGRMRSISQTDQSSVRTFTLSYDENGYLSAVIDPAGREFSYINDIMGRPEALVRPDGRQIDFTYDNMGNLTAVSPPGRPAHSFGYTAVHLADTYTPPSAAGISNVSTIYTYNLDRQIESVTRPDGRTVDYVYDAASRLSALRLPNGEITEYIYNKETGQLIRMHAPGGESLDVAVDGDLLTSRTWNGTVSGTVSNTYDNTFRTASQSINGAETVDFEYDDDGLLTSAGELKLFRDPKTGRIIGAALDGVKSTFSYNGFGELVSASHAFEKSVLYETSIVRDTLGRIAQKTETIESETALYRYSYDSVGRLTDVYLNSDTVPLSHYEYDANGNRISFQDYRSGSAVENNGAYDDQDRMGSYGNAADGYAKYTYTDNGELLTKTLNSDVTEYHYDVLGNLRGVTLPNGMDIDYIIDAENRRVGKVVNGVLETGLLYKDTLNPIAELDSGNNVVSRFVYGSKSNVPDYFTSNKEDGDTWQTYRIISNHLGSPRLVLNIDTGEIVQRLDYDEFGQVLEDTNPGFQPFGFAGGIYDTDTGLVKFGARDYDAETGRWTAKDPIRFAGGDTNLYGYVMSDPVNFIDPLGYSALGDALKELREFVTENGNVTGVFAIGKGIGAIGTVSASEEGVSFSIGGGITFGAGAALTGGICVEGGDGWSFAVTGAGGAGGSASKGENVNYGGFGTLGWNFSSESMFIGAGAGLGLGAVFSAAGSYTKTYTWDEAFGAFE